MNDMPRYSVVMPAFNTEVYIGEAIESILNQSVPDWELIVIDDGSTDDTAEVAGRFRDPRIRVRTQSNRGLSATRNRGIRESRGDMIIFFDSDDRLRPEALERLGTALARFPLANVAYGECVVMDHDGYVFGLGTKPIFSRRPSGNVLKYILQKNVMQPGATLIRRYCLARCGFFHEDLLGAEDWEMWSRMATFNEFVYVGGAPILEYRLRSDSISRRLCKERGIGHILRCIEEVFSNPEIAGRFSKGELSRLRKRREGDVYAWIGTENLKKRNWKEARDYLLRSLRCSPGNPRVVILLGFVMARQLPYALERRLK